MAPSRINPIVTLNFYKSLCATPSTVRKPFCTANPMVGGTFSHSYRRENKLHRMCPALSTHSAASVVYENGHSCQAGVFRLPTGGRPIAFGFTLC